MVRSALRSSTLCIVSFFCAAVVASSAQTPPQQPPAWNEVPPPAGAFREHNEAYRTDTVDVAVKPEGGSIEYMVRMREGASLVYSWHAVEIANPSALTSEFHGHTDRAPGTTGTLVFYRKATGGTESGSLVAPFDGTHGWYFKNDTNRPVIVRVTLAGFYTVIPDQIKE